MSLCTGMNAEIASRLASKCTQNSPLVLELSRSVKENHGTAIIKIAAPATMSPMRNIVAVLSSQQVNIYDTDNLAQGHVDLLSHYHNVSSDSEFVDCCWLANESDGYLAILCSNGHIQLLSLSYSAVISSIWCPSGMRITKIFADPTDGERLFGVDEQADLLHLFSYDSNATSAHLDQENLHRAVVVCADGQLFEIASDRRRLRPLVASSDETLLELVEGTIEFASIRGDDYLVIDDTGRVMGVHDSEQLRISERIWRARGEVAHDGDGLVAISCSDGALVLLDLYSRQCTSVSNVCKGQATVTSCLFIQETHCCRQGLARRVMLGDSTGMLSVYRIVSK